MKKLSFLACAVFALAMETGWAQPGNPASWKILAEGGAVVELTLEPVAPAGGQDTNTLRLTVEKTGRLFGIFCADMGATRLASGQWYDLSFNARTDTPKTFALTVSLESRDGKRVCARTTLPEVGGLEWRHFSVALHVRQPAAKCRLVIALADTGTIWLNDLSLVRRETSKP